MNTVSVNIFHDSLQSSKKIDLRQKDVATLSNFLITLKQTSGSWSTLAVDGFQYTDDESDNVLVRSEDEFQTFVHFVLNSIPSDGDNENLVTVRPVFRTKSQVASLSPLTLSLNDETNKQAIGYGNDFTDGNSRSIRANLDASASALSLSNINSGDLRPLKLLGSGHCGSVYKALDVRNDRFIAVKSIPLDLSTQVKEQILSEMNILYQCSCPFIIEFYGACFTENSVSIYTEYMDGGSMDQAVRRVGPVEEPVLRAVAVASVSGLCYLWDMKIMHRDVKPSNILVNSKGDVKLCDFGVSVQLVNSIAKSYVGTSVYMAPERLLGNEYTVRSDVWSLGLSLLEMALGRFPYHDTGQPNQRPVALMEKIIDQDPPSLSGTTFGLDLTNFIDQCLQKEPEKRPTFCDLRDDSLITSNMPFNRAAVADWVTRSLKE